MAWRLMVFEGRRMLTRPLLLLLTALWLAWAYPAMAGVWLSGMAFMPLAFFWASCPCCGCACVNCTSGQTQSVQADISGVVNDSCSDCAGINGTWVLPVVSTASWFTTCCWYDYDLGGTPCGFTNMRWFFGNAGQGFVCNDYITYPFDASQFTAPYSADCASSSPTYVSSGYGECDWSGATVTITSV